MKINKKALVPLFTAGLLLTACDSTIFNNEDQTSEPAQEQADQQAPVEDNDGTQSGEAIQVETDVTQAVEEVDEAVVSVLNMQTINTTDNYGSLFDFYDLPTPDTEQPNQEETELQEAGSGSGVVYKTEGGEAYVVTNNHVVDGSDAVEVLFKDGTSVEAELVGADVWTDLAVLKVSADPVTKVAEFGDSDALTVGEPAIAIGSPLGTEFASSVTSGIISAKGRSVPVDINGDGISDWETTALQTDAAINPGNSGGALVNIHGQVVGINSMKISLSSVEGMGFSIPSNDVVNIVSQLEETGEVIRPYLGITLLDVNLVSEQDKRQVLNLPEDVENGVVSQSVQANSPADKAGLEQYDVIVGFNGQEITNSVDLRQVIYSVEIGAEVEVEFYRDGELMTSTVVMEAADNVDNM